MTLQATSVFHYWDCGIVAPETFSSTIPNPSYRGLGSCTLSIRLVPNSTSPAEKARAALVFEKNGEGEERSEARRSEARRSEARRAASEAKRSEAKRSEQVATSVGVAGSLRSQVATSVGVALVATGSLRSQGATSVGVAGSLRSQVATSVGVAGSLRTQALMKTKILR